MGIIDDSASPSLLINHKFVVPTYQVPRVLSELQQERKDSLSRTKYIRRVEENWSMTREERRKREFAEMEKRRKSKPPAQ